MKVFLLALALVVMFAVAVVVANGALSNQPVVKVDCNNLQTAPIDVVERCQKVIQSQAQFNQEHTLQWLQAQQDLQMRGVAVSLIQLVVAIAGGAFLLTLGFGGGFVIVNWLRTSSDLIRPKNGLYPIQKMRVGNNIVLINPNTGAVQTIEAHHDTPRRLIGQNNQTLRLSSLPSDGDAAVSRQNMVQAIQAAQKLPPGAASTNAVQAAIKSADTQQESFSVKSINQKQLSTVSLDGGDQPLLLEDEI